MNEEKLTEIINEVFAIMLETMTVDDILEWNKDDSAELARSILESGVLDV